VHPVEVTLVEESVDRRAHAVTNTRHRPERVRPHPEVRGWRPAFRGRRSRSFRQSINWIESMYKPRPAYPIEYTPPALREGSSEKKYEPVER